MFLYSLVCSVLGTLMPGPGTLQIEQELMFPSATPVGEEVEIRVEVTQVQPSESLADLTTLVVRPDGHRGLQGRTLVRLPGSQLARFPLPDSTIPDSPVADSRSLKGMEIGQRAQTHRTFTAADLAEYADLTGDTNPLFTDPGYTRDLGLEGPVVPGGLLGGLFSYLLGTDLPGRGTNYLKQRLHFLTPAYVSHKLTASVEIVRIRPEKQLVNLSTVCLAGSDNVVCFGEALVLVSDVVREA
jgi:acyl dehydratase